MARNKKSKGGGLRGDEWMATYADTVTLLLTFFVLLYSLSSVDSEKTKSISNAFTSMMSGEGGNSLLKYNLYNGEVPLIGGETTEPIEGAEELTEQKKLYNNLKNFVVQNNLQGVVEIIDDERGVAIQLRDNILFETSSSDLREESKDILNKLQVLIYAAKNVSKGNFKEIEAEQTDIYEINILYEAFDKMIRNIKGYIDSLKEKAELEAKIKDDEMKLLKYENALKLSQLKVLQSQINPHFLFKTLNCINQTAIS